MGLKKKSKVSAQFNMSSLTDIIFLLLIFFMLTSSLVAPNALNLKLPGSSTARPNVAQQMDDVSIRSNGTYYLNGKRIELEALEGEIRRIGRSGRPKMTISPNASAPIENLVAVMDLAMKSDVEAILATDLN